MRTTLKARQRTSLRAAARLLYVAAVLGTAGCVQKMANQPRLEPLEKSDFFSDGMASRELVAGTVPRGSSLRVEPNLSKHFLTGLKDGKPTDELPPEIHQDWELGDLLERGRERYGIYCVHCHDELGHGNGMVPLRGFPDPPTYHSKRLRSARLSYFVRVIEAGHGQMPAHGDIVPPADRWAIATYIRALQLSQHAEESLLEQDDLKPLTEETERGRSDTDRDNPTEES